MPITERTQPGSAARLRACAAAPGPLTWGLRGSTDPGSGTAFSPRRTRPGLSEACRRSFETVNASGSFAVRRSPKGPRQRRPNRFRKACRIAALTSSLPFDTVNCVTSRTAIAAVSDGVQRSGRAPSAAYSAGSSSGFELISSIRALIPSM